MTWLKTRHDLLIRNFFVTYHCHIIATTKLRYESRFHVCAHTTTMCISQRVSEQEEEKL